MMASIRDPFTGYNYNTSYIGHGQFERIQEPVKASAVRHPDATVLFGNGQYSGGANKFMRAPLNPDSGCSTTCVPNPSAWRWKVIYA